MQYLSAIPPTKVPSAATGTSSGIGSFRNRTCNASGKTNPMPTTKIQNCGEDEPIKSISHESWAVSEKLYRSNMYAIRIIASMMPNAAEAPHNVIDTGFLLLIIASVTMIAAAPVDKDDSKKSATNNQVFQMSMLAILESKMPVYVMVAIANTPSTIQLNQRRSLGINFISRPHMTRIAEMMVKMTTIHVPIVTILFSGEMSSSQNRSMTPRSRSKNAKPVIIASGAMIKPS